MEFRDVNGGNIFSLTEAKMITLVLFRPQQDPPTTVT